MFEPEGDGVGEGEGRGEADGAAVGVGVAERVAATEPEPVSEASPVIVRVLLPPRGAGSDPNAGAATDSAPFLMPVLILIPVRP